MAISFPTSPATNDTYTFANKTWVFNGEAWDLVTTDLSPFTDKANAAYVVANSAFDKANNAYDQSNTKTYTFYQNTAPATSNAHDLWVDTSSGILYENFGTTSSPIWVEFGPSGVTLGTSIFGPFGDVSIAAVSGNTGGKSVYITAGTGTGNNDATSDYVSGSGGDVTISAGRANADAVIVNYAVDGSIHLVTGDGTGNTSVSNTWSFWAGGSTEFPGAITVNGESWLWGNVWIGGTQLSTSLISSIGALAAYSPKGNSNSNGANASMKVVSPNSFLLDGIVNDYTSQFNVSIAQENSNAVVYIENTRPAGIYYGGNLMSGYYTGTYNKSDGTITGIANTFNYIERNVKVQVSPEIEQKSSFVLHFVQYGITGGLEPTRITYIHLYNGVGNLVVEKLPN